MLVKAISGCPWWHSRKESACQEGEAESIPGLGRPPGEGNGNPLQESCQGNPRDRGAWQATVHGVTKRHNSHTDTHTHTHNKDNNHKSEVQRAIFLILNIGPLTNVLNQTRVLWD